jgi:hypothetical protein
MGEVYPARDTHLDRALAVNTLPPDICTLYDASEYNGATFLVTEHLADRIRTVAIKVLSTAAAGHPERLCAESKGAAA